MTKPGETVLDVDEGNHLHIVLSTETDAGQVAIANFTTHYESHRRRPTGCLIIAPHEHPWLRHESCIAYEHARLFDMERLNQKIRQGQLAQQQPCSATLLRRIQLEALDSILVPNDAKAAIRATITTDSME